MATITPVLSAPVPGTCFHETYVMGNGDVGIGTPLGAGRHSIQVVGALGAVTGTMVLEGSNDGTNWTTLSDIAGAALSFSGIGAINSIKHFEAAVAKIRPRVTAGDGTTNLTITIR